MASGLFFNPAVLLRVAPLITSTMAMRFSHDQYFMLDALLAPEHRNRANDLVPSYFRAFFSKGIWDIAALYTLTTATGLANILGAGNAAGVSPSSSARGWFIAGTTLAVLHMAFVPKIMWPVDALLKDEPKGHGNENLRKWLNVHVVRSWCVDIPAWACFVVACLQSLQVVPN
ncbi:uncharacterized protein B0I36DRAFT_319377 [Microdochium trichocladiopsis]|uniref:Uncharacterized protein n=1 Tax=Microdochium trichocladiopsis TaxID=1682393 RepID=A0A9P8YCT7_9PEZI|nr:uncharacterized protein B0I36DRAFT_319377 [Microdochium trichocladiopsis]KAH7035917.1 hypothetical protein B0I36DRAFT_319377 [Microdochium trichocladiopsis]